MLRREIRRQYGCRLQESFPRGWTYPPATICDHDFAKDEALSRLTIGSPWRDSGLTSPVSRDCVSGASPCVVVLTGLGIVDRAGKTEAMAASRELRRGEDLGSVIHEDVLVCLVC